MRVCACSIAVVCFLALAVSAAAQTSSANSTATSASDLVPRLIKFSSTARDETGKLMSGVLGITFTLYKDEQGGAPLWFETQNVQADAAGHYTVMLGSATRDGVPLSLFSAAEVHWIGTQVSGHQEQSRVFLLSVPYALKAADAETLGGMPASAFVLNEANGASSGAVGNQAISSAKVPFSSSSAPPPPAGPTSFSGSNTTQIVSVTQAGTGEGLSATSTTHGAIAGTITGPSNTAVYGLATNTSSGSNAAGVTGASNTQMGPGVQGVTSSSTGFGVQGVVTAASGGTAVQGLNKATSGYSLGVAGQTSSTTANSTGVNGFESATTRSTA